MGRNESEEGSVSELALVVPKQGENREEEKEEDNDDAAADCVEILTDELRKKGLIVETVSGLQNEFIKLHAPLEVLGKVAAELRFRKRTHVGMNLPFEWDEADAFVRHPDGSLFGWGERIRCYNHILYGIVNTGTKAIMLKYNCMEVEWNPGEPLLRKLESVGIVKEVFPLHDESKRKQLLRSWAMNWLDFTTQPIDDICSYYGVKVIIVLHPGDGLSTMRYVATYFAFLGMYTKWMLFPAALGLAVYLIDFGSSQLLVLPVFFVCVIAWAVLFFQFWKRKSSALSNRWHINDSGDAESEYRFWHTDRSTLSSPTEQLKKRGTDKLKERAAFEREEWFSWLMRLRNDVFVIMGIICLQLPFELAYAHLAEVIGSELLKFFLTLLYLVGIQYFTRTGAKISVKLIRKENYENMEYSANSLIYKVFGLYFMQSYIGLFYHALLYRNLMSLRQILIQRLVGTEVIGNLFENSIPYLIYSIKKFRAIRNKRKHEKGQPKDKRQSMPRVEKEYLKASYAASIGQELEDGLFDDFLEVVLQFGMIMMFACAFPLAFTFALLNNITEIRADALKLLAMMRRPIARVDASIGGWLNIFQLLIVASICTNCALLVCLYDREGNWNLSPGLGAILVMEHVLLFIKFGFSRLVPDEPEWVRASRKEHVTRAEEMCSKQLLRSISADENAFKEMKKND
ncbi:anoctamin-like protein-like [Dorcoceras hygrometricum]|uniref:Anoctamin-like protein-like n=1 Tax=Dorcoceras hygrometricum TaxID=472368 RepID=A0A2Z7C803_9LAMI|nr:anoctamin-like protein-like [Dorcoceras hygrometricum]